MRFSVSSDSTTYHYGDLIRVTVTAANIGNTPDTLWLTNCDAGYYVDSSGPFIDRPCELTIVPYVIQPHDSLQWPFLPPYPVNKDTIAIGRHALVGRILNYVSDTTWITISTVTAVQQVKRDRQEYALEDNYTDPFNPTTTISYELAYKSLVTLKVYDLFRRVVLVDEQQTAGMYRVPLDAANLPSGLYFYRLQAGTFVQTKKMIVLKYQLKERLWVIQRIFLSTFIKIGEFPTLTISL